jgi:NAD-dependent dihydropyrimidine dehydrogenase PreA subunit
MWEIDRKKCLRCGACVGVCQKMALDLKEFGISHDKNLCIDCGICERVCPVGAIKVRK